MDVHLVVTEEVIDNFITLRADAAATLDDCVNEAIVWCIFKKKDVRLLYRDQTYFAYYQKLQETIISLA